MRNKNIWFLNQPSTASNYIEDRSLVSGWTKQWLKLERELVYKETSYSWGRIILCELQRTQFVYFLWKEGHIDMIHKWTPKKCAYQDLHCSCLAATSGCCWRNLDLNWNDCKLEVEARRWGDDVMQTYVVDIAVDHDVGVGEWRNLWLARWKLNKYYVQGGPTGSNTGN